MSTSNQSNGKKTSSTNNSTTNTPSSTPVSTIANSANGQAPVQSTTPPNNAPKYGTLVPNRIFVGGISANTTEAELLQLFSNYGTVKAAKIIQDRAGVSKGYGFITFESEEEAKRLQREADNIVLRERKLNIAPAIKKQPFSRAFDAASPPTITAGGPAQYFIPAGGVPFYQGGVTYYPQPGPPGEINNQHQQPPVYQPPAVYPTQSGPPQTAAYPSLVYPTQPLYMPQQFPYQPVPYDYNYYPNGGPPQYMVGNQGTPQPQPPPMQPPGSPPRTPCYNPQLSYGADAVYYNVPMYGPVEGTTVYQDPLDMANGNLAEDSFGFATSVSQDLESSVPIQNINTTSDLTTNTTTIDTTRQSATPVVSLLSLDQHQEKDFTALQSGRRRKSVDPAPSTNNSLHHFGPNGFVPPLYTNPTNLRSSYPNIVNTSNMNHMNHSHNAMPPVSTNTFNGCLSFTPPPPNEFCSMPTFKSAPNLNSNDRSIWYNKRQNRNMDRRNSEGFYNPLRTESNSSASVVDENRNEEKNYRTTINTPPPAPYSPIMQYGMMGNKYNSRNFHNTRQGGRGGGFQGFNNIRSHNTYPSNTNTKPFYNRNNNPMKRPGGIRNFSKNNNQGSYNVLSKREESKNLGSSSASDKTVESINVDGDKSDEAVTSRDNTPTDAVLDTPNVIAGNPTSESSSLPVSPVITNCSNSNTNLTSLPPQIPPGGSQNFIPPARRTRRSVRRNTHAGAPLSEIGAGDAPLPTTEVGDTCKKLDNLKL